MVTVTQRPEVGPAAQILLADLAADAPRFFDRLVAVLVGQAEFPDDDLVVDAGLVDVAEHFGDPAERPARRGRPSGDLDDDHVAGLRVQVLVRRDLDVHDQPPVERHHEADAHAVQVEPADDRLGAAFEHAHDSPLGAVAADPLDTRDDAVAVHRLVQVAAGDVEVAR